MEIQFFGATGQVTGSCFLLRVGDRRVLVECGLVQGSTEEERRNRDPFPFDPTALDAVVLTHGHLDHSGRLPLLVQRGYTGVIHTHPATVDLCRLLLEDAGHLNEKEAEWQNRKRERKGLEPVPPLYTRAEAQAAHDRFRPLEYGRPTEIVPGVRLTLHDAGHILGSAIAELELTERGTTRRVVFSGDLGHRGAPILRDPSLLQRADWVVMESTYGDRTHRSWQATWQELGEVVSGARAERGNILIPSFAVGRAQELLYAFRQHYDAWGLDDWQVFLDSPMAIEATEVYARHAQVYDKRARAAWEETGNPFDLPNLHLSRRAEDSMHLNRLRSGAIIIAGSGMCTGGRIKHHLKHHIWRRHTHLMIVGFQARGTLGRALVDGARHIRLWGETIKVEAQVHTIGGLSAHADQRGLLDWFGHFDPLPRLALVHGEPEAMEVLAERVEAETGVRPLRPELGQRVEL